MKRIAVILKTSDIQDLPGFKADFSVDKAIELIMNYSLMEFYLAPIDAFPDI